MKNRLAASLHSAVSWLFLSLFLLISPLVLFLLYTMDQSHKQAVQAVASAYETLLQSMMMELSSQLTQISYFTEDFAFKQSDPKLAAYTSDTAESVYAMNRIYQNLGNEASRYSVLGALFFYFSDRELFTTCVRDGKSKEAQNDMEVYVKERLTASDAPAKNFPWELVNVNGQSYLFHMTRNNDIVAGSFIPRESVLLALSSEQPEQELILFTPEDSLPEELFVSIPSAWNFSLGYRIQRQEIFSGLPFISKHAAVIILLLVFDLLALLLVVHGLVARPIARLTGALQEIRGGNIDYRIPPAATAEEFRMLNENFNDTMDQICHLKIDVYEEHLRAQKFKVNLLRLQVKPHFLINSLNMVYSQLATGHEETARSLILYNIQYLRFMMKTGDNFITLSEELEHIAFYLKIQELRYQEKFVYDQQIDPLTRDAGFPPLLLHQFVENSIKYALSPFQVLRIHVQTKYQEIHLDPFIQIVIADNGPGFPQDILDALNEGRGVRAEDGGRFGIASYMEQLQFLFEEFSWRFYNAEGACVELLFPIISVPDESESLKSL